MEFGINLATSADSWKIVERAEALGFTSASFYDTQLLNADVFVAMAAAAMKTSRIRLATGVLIPSNRIAPVTASALASLNKLAPGRIEFGVATGFTARRTMGLGAIRMGELADYIRVVTALLARETVTWNYEGKDRKIRFLNPELDLINTDDAIPVHISAFGPRGRRLVAELGAGWILSVRDPDIAAKAMADMRNAWKAAGRDPDEMVATAVASGCILADGEPYDSPRAKAQGGPSASMVLHDLAEASERGNLGHAIPPEAEPVLREFLEIYKSYEPADARYLSNHRGHLMILRPEEEALINADMIRTLSFTGPAAELRDRIRALRDAGFGRFSAHIRYGQPQMLEEWADLLATV